MNNILIAEKKVELLKIQASKADIGLNILKKYDEIERLKKQIEIQEVREEELKKQIEEIK